MKIYRFRNFVLNTFERSLLRDGERLHLTPKTFDVLQMLVEQAGEIVTKDELLGGVWKGSIVEEGNLAVYICKLRRLLNETAAERCIETDFRNGYHFIARTSSDWVDTVPCEPDIKSGYFASCDPQPVVGWIKIENKYVVIRIEVEGERVSDRNDVRKERERERVCFSLAAVLKFDRPWTHTLVDYSYPKIVYQWGLKRLPMRGF